MLLLVLRNAAVSIGTLLRQLGYPSYYYTTAISSMFRKYCNLLIITLSTVLGFRIIILSTF